MADLTLRIAGDVDAKELVGLAGTAEELTKALKELEVAADDVSGKRIAINIETTTKGSGRIKEVLDATEELDASTLKLQRSIKKATAAEQGSIASSKALVANLAQQKNATRTGSEAWGKLDKKLTEASSAYSKAKGIQEGSVTALRQQVSALKQASSNTSLTEATTRSYADAISKLNARVREQEGVQAGSKSDLQAIRQELVLARDATDRFTDPKSFKRLSVQIQATEDRLDSFVSVGARFGKIVDTIGRVRVAFDTVSQVLQAFNQAIGIFVARTKQVESFALALKNVGLSTREVNKAFKQASDTANALGAPLQGVERSYKRMVPALRGIGASAQKSDEFIEALSARTVTLGLNTEQSGRLFEAFAQVLSKGKLQGEELNQQISELDGSFRGQFAEALGIATDELNELIEAGAVSSTLFVQGVLDMENGVEALKEGVKSGNATIQQLQNAIGNLQTKNVESLAKSFDPLFKSVLRAQKGFEELISAFAKTSIFRRVSELISKLIEGFGQFVQIISPIITLVVGIISAILDIAAAIDKVIPVFSNAANSAGLLIAGLTALATFSLLKLMFAKIAIQVTRLGLACAGSAAHAKTLNTALQLLRANKFKAAIGEAITLVTGFGGSLGKTKKVAKNTLPSWMKVTKAGAELGAATYVAKQGAGGLATNLGGLGLKAKTAAIRLRGAALAATPLGIAILAAAVPVAVFTAGLIGYARGLDKTQKSQKIVKKALNETTGTWDKTKEAVGRVTKETKKAGDGVFYFLNIAGRIKENFGNEAFIGITDGARKADAGIQKLRKNVASSSEVLNENSNFVKQSNEDLKLNASNHEAAAAAIQANIDAIGAEIEALEAQEKPNNNQIQSLKALKQGYEAEQGVVGKTVAGINKELASRGLLDKKIKLAGASLRYLTSQQAGLIKNSEKLKLNAQANSYEKLAKGVYNTAQAEAARLSAQAIGDRAILKNLLGQREAYKKLAKENGSLSKEDIERSKKVEEAIVKQRIVAAQSYIAVKESIVNAFEAGINKANELADIAIASAARISAAFDTIASTTTSGIQAGLQVVETVSGAIQAQISTETSKRLKGIKAAESAQLAAISRAGLSSEQAEAQKASASAKFAKQRRDIEQQGAEAQREILIKELSFKSEMLDVEIDIEALRLDSASKVAIAEAKSMQARLRGEAAIAKTKGNDKAAAELLRAANLQNVVIDGAKRDLELQKKILVFKKAQGQAQIAATAQQNNIQGFNVPDLDRSILQVKEFTKSASSSSKYFADISNKAVAVGQSLSGKNIEGGEESAKGVQDAMEASVQSSEKLEKNMVLAAESFAKSLGAAKELSGVLRDIEFTVNGTSRRATGGPVAAGSEYLVNDGGGREAFLNSFGRMSMLPPGRNIKWTAPSTGTVIPAHLVDDFKSRLIAKEQMSSSSSYQQPKQPVSRNIIKSSHTQSLSSSSSTQRIVNHVTIQSQSPVTDASELMANVSKLKSRRRR